MKLDRFAAYAWGVVAINILVVLWGAYVRASGSGAGCGAHWPLCNGELIPRAPRIETLVELSHRLSSGIALLAVVVLLVWAWRAFPKGDPVRLGALFSMLFMLSEALIGAGLVLFEYVATNVSVARAFWIAGHLTNTFLLLAALSLTAWWSSGGEPVQLKGRTSLAWPLALALAAVLVLGASGGVTALGDTLVLSAGISPEESPIVAGLVSLRIYHPLLAFGAGALVLFAAWRVGKTRPSVQSRRLTMILIAVYVAQLCTGALNVFLRAPIWLQLSHLLFSDLIWITLVLLAATALARAPAAVELPLRASVASTHGGELA